MAEVGLELRSNALQSLCTLSVEREWLSPCASSVGTPLTILGTEPGASEHLITFAALG